MRLFLAIPIEPATQERLLNKVRELQGHSWSKDIKWIPAENYHLTLHFLGGSLNDTQKNKIITSMSHWFSEGMSAFDIEIKSIQLFPSKLHPHLITASLDSNIMMQCLVREIEEQLKPLGFNPTKQAFRPHITLGKILPTADLSFLIQNSPLIKLNDFTLKVNKITLFESTISQPYPTYTPLSEILLECYD